MRPIIHAAQEQGELCLEFDHDLDKAVHGQKGSMIKLEQNGKAVPLRAQDITIEANLLCLSALEHREGYRIAVRDLRGKNGEKLAATYGLGFAIPDRPPSLAFLGSINGITRWDKSDPVLRSVNLPSVNLELIRVTNIDAMAQAWRERRQPTLAPSESLTFGHDKGQVIWTGTLDLGSTRNQTLEHKVPLGESIKNVSPGLYLLLAKVPTPPDDKDSLAPAAASWLIKSDLRLRALQDRDGFYALTSKATSTETFPAVHVTVMDANGQKLAENDTGLDGMSFLPLHDEALRSASTLLAMTPSGDVDFVDLPTLGPMGRFMGPGNEVSIALDHPFYAPGDPVIARLSVSDAAGKPLPAADASLQIERADGTFYNQIPAPSGNDGLGKITFNAPASGGLWQLKWRRGNGELLAKSTLRVTSDNSAPRIEIQSDRSVLPANGEMTLALKSLTADNRPAPYTMGRVFGSWLVPDHAPMVADDIRFGDGDAPAAEPKPLTSFVTDANGLATLHITPPPPTDHAALHALSISLREDTASGAAVPPPLILPVRPAETIIGIRPLASEGRFPENGLARFSIVAIDPEGRRRAAEDLAWQIYEEGRSFDWYQADGRWKYKPLQEKRRIGGGTLKPDEDGTTSIEWPVTAGTYRIEITDVDGRVRAATGFSAGWETPHVSTLINELKLDAPPKLVPGQEGRITFKLDHASVISAVIGDDHVRRIIHEARPAGENSISFIPALDWHDHIEVRVIDEAGGRAGEVEMPLLKNEKPGNATEALAPIDDVLSLDEEYPETLRQGDSVRLSFNLKNAGKTGAIDHYAIAVQPGLKLTESAQGAVNLAPAQSRKIFFTLTGQAAASSSLKISVSSFPHLNLERKWALAVTPPDRILEKTGDKHIAAQESWTSQNLSPPQKFGDDDLVFLGSRNFVDAPLHLPALLQAHPVTSAEMAATAEALRLWRDPILQSGLCLESAYNALQKDLLLRLLERQKPDGGFAPRSDGDADLMSTARALTALAHADPGLAKAGSQLASNWLQAHLDNTWFDEKERPARAASYAALAASDHLEPSSLYYFSDTSVDKSLPPLAAAQLAFAFAKLGDQGKSSFWLDVARAGFDWNAIPIDLILPLIGNPNLDVTQLQPALEAASSEIKAETPQDLDHLTIFMRGVALMAQRAGVYRVTVGSDHRAPKGVLTIAGNATGLPDIHAQDSDLDLLFAHKDVPEQGPAISIQRRILELDGSEVTDQASLRIGSTYLVILSGTWKADPGTGQESASLRLHDNAAPGWRIKGCLPPAPLATGPQLSWLKGQALSEPVSCEAGADGIDMMLTKRDGSQAWHAAFLARAEWGGTFSLPPAIAQPMNFKGGPQITPLRQLKIK